MMQLDHKLDPAVPGDLENEIHFEWSKRKRDFHLIRDGVEDDKSCYFCLNISYLFSYFLANAVIVHAPSGPISI